MGDRTGIEWTDATWNPLRGCSRVSEGCRNCYAETVAARFSGPGLPYEGLARDGRWTGKVALVEKHLADPLRWTRPRRIFVNSMSDLFHERVPDEWIDRIFAVMALTPQHTFQVLTKRPERMERYFLPERQLRRRIWEAADVFCRGGAGPRWRNIYDALPPGGRPGTGPDACFVRDWPLPNVWLGVSVEDQATADARIPLLLQTPAAVRFVSYEPALGPVDFERIDHRPCEIDSLGGVYHLTHPPGIDHDGGVESVDGGPRLDWIIVGGESGPGARPFDVAWARSAIAQCRAAGVACFVKQLGARPEGPEPCRDCDPCLAKQPCSLAYNVALSLRDRKGSDMAEWPQDLRVREMPAVQP